MAACPIPCRMTCWPDIYLRPDANGVRLLQFNRIEMILEHAGPAAEELRRRLEESLAKH